MAAASVKESVKVKKDHDHGRGAYALKESMTARGRDQDRYVMLKGDLHRHLDNLEQQFIKDKQYEQELEK